MAKIPEDIPKYADKEVIKRLKQGSDNYNVYMYLSHGNSLTVALARRLDPSLTQDLTSRINELINTFKVPISSDRVMKNGVLKRYKQYWITGSNEILDNSLLLSEVQ